VRSRRNSGHRDEDALETPAAAAFPPAVEQVLALQRTAGNAAVTNVLARYEDVSTIVAKPTTEEDEDDWDDDDEEEEEQVVPPPSSAPKRSEAEQREYDKKLAAAGYEIQPAATAEEPVEVKDEKSLRKLEKKERRRAERQAEQDKEDRGKQRRATYEQRKEARRQHFGMGPLLEPWADPNEGRAEKRHTFEIQKLERRIEELQARIRKVSPSLTAEHAALRAKIRELADERDARAKEKERLRQVRDAPPARPYAFQVKGVDERYIDEEESTEIFIAGAMDHLASDKERHGFGHLDDREALKVVYGWSEEDCVKYYDNADKGQKAAGAKTEQLRTEEQRAKHRLALGAEIRQAGEPFDTSRSTSKASGPGFAIFVMSERGQFYAGSHKVGLFHHSSLLGGEDAACGGEMKATAGRLEHVTNKSGHYTPNPVHLQQALGELARGGVKLGGVTATVWDKTKEGKIVKRRYDAADYMRRGAGAKVVEEWLED
jgi:hypothetical protein